MSTDGEHCCSVTLTVVGEDLDPEAVSKVLGMEPDRSWRRGDRKGLTRPDGTVKQFDSVYEDGGWKKFIPKQYQDKPLSDQVYLWLFNLHDLRDAIMGLQERGWVTELDCFTASTEVLVLFNDHLRQIADLGVGLGLTIGLVSEA